MKGYQTKQWAIKNKGKSVVSLYEPKIAQSEADLEFLAKALSNGTARFVTRDLLGLDWLILDHCPCYFLVRVGVLVEVA